MFWHERAVVKVDGQLVHGCDRELVQTYEVIGDYARCYWPMELVKPLVRENWCLFLSARPAPVRPLMRMSPNPAQAALGRRAAVLVHE